MELYNVWSLLFWAFCFIFLKNKLGMVVHTFNPSTQEAEAVRSLSWRPAWSIEQVSVPSRLLHREALSWKTLFLFLCVWMFFPYVCVPPCHSEVSLAKLVALTWQVTQSFLSRSETYLPLLGKMPLAFSSLMRSMRCEGREVEATSEGRVSRRTRSTNCLWRWTVSVTDIL